MDSFFMNQIQLKEKPIYEIFQVKNNLMPSEDPAEKLTFTLLCGCKLNQYGELIKQCLPHTEANFIK